MHQLILCIRKGNQAKQLSGIHRGAVSGANFFRPAEHFRNYMRAPKMRDFNGAGKQAKRRRWRMKQACFEEGSQIADTQYSLFGLSRRCIPSWVSRAHPSLPSRSIYHFIDSIKRDRFRAVPLLHVVRSDIWRQHEIHGVDTGGSAAVNAAEYAVISNNK